MLDEQDATNRDAKGLPFTVSRSPRKLLTLPLELYLYPRSELSS